MKNREGVQEVKTAKNNSLYDFEVLGRKRGTATAVTLFREQECGSTALVSCKIGRYNTKNGEIDFQNAEIENPKSIVKLNPEEFEALLEFLGNKAALLKSSVKRYIPVDHINDEEFLSALGMYLRHNQFQELVNLLLNNDLLPGDLSNALTNRKRAKELDTFRESLDKNLTEHFWQGWFSENGWALGSEHVRILPEREIDNGNTSDYLVHAADNHLDLVEIKRPSLPFWAQERDHNNLVPHSHLIKAITQVQNYLYELEREMNSEKTQERLGLPIAKPRATLIFGRSLGWDRSHYTAQRLLNGGYTNVQIFTYDQIQERASRLLDSKP